MDKEWKIKIGGLKESANDFDKLKKSVDDSKNSLNAQNKTVGDYSKAIREANKEIKNIQGEMLGLEKGSTAWTELAKKAGEYKDRIDDIREATRRYASDTKGLDDVINLAQSATAAFTLYKGAMSAFGVETENAEEALAELAGAMSIIQSLQTLSNTLKGSSATASLFNTVMKATGVELIQTQLAAIKATAAQEGLSTAQKAGAVASKALGLAMKAIPFMLVIGLVASLIAYWEDIVGWFDKTFPALEKMGGAMNILKGVLVGVGKAVVHWLINPWKTWANVIKKIMEGDFSGAVEEAINGVKKQYVGLVDSFKEGFQGQIERGMEDMSRKAAAEMDKTLTHQKNMITKQKNADGTYRKEYIEANKKMFANRKKMYKKDSDEYRKVLEDEAAFNQQVEDSKTAATEKAAADRAKANKDAAKAAAEALKKQQEELKRYLDASHAYTNSILDSKILKDKNLERLQQRRLEGYESGPVEKYTEELKKLRDIQKDINNAEMAKELNNLSKSLADNVKYLNENNATWKSYVNNYIESTKQLALANGKTAKEAEDNAKLLANDISNIWQFMLTDLTSNTDKERFALIDSLSLNQADTTIVLNTWEQLHQMILKSADNTNAELIDNENKLLAVRKAELDVFSKDAERSYQWLMKRVKDMDVEPVTKDNIWGKLFGVIDEQETINKYERIKKMWVRAYNEIQTQIDNASIKWDKYLATVEQTYGKDSSEYKKANQEKIDALEKLKEKALEVGKVANAPTSTGGDYNADGEQDTPSGVTTASGDSIQKGLGKFNEFFEKINETLLAPAMDTFSMFMDFAIEETAQRLEQVQEMHDKALDKVNESADKIKELNDSLRDSGNDNMEATKQQLADEQLLYAQRLAEERKLADEEKALKNKQAQQEANARKMELRYQMVMAVANTAQGASKALATWGWPLGAVFAGIMAALGAVQVALIAKQIGAIKPVKYAEGGIISGKPHSQGGVPVGNTNIEVEGGEMVVSKKNTQRYRDVLYKINHNDPSVRYLQGSSRQYADTKIRKYASGGELNFDRADETLRTQQDTNRLMSAIDNINMTPIVTVKDIWKAEDRLVKVRGLAGR